MKITSIIFILFALLEVQAQDKIYKLADHMPALAECQESEDMNCTLAEITKFIIENVKYPESAKVNGTEGVAVVDFVVHKNGQLEQFALVKDPGDGCGAEALRVVKLLGEQLKWRPGKIGDQDVSVQFSLPVSFKLGKNDGQGQIELLNATGYNEYAMLLNPPVPPAPPAPPTPATELKNPEAIQPDAPLPPPPPPVFTSPPLPPAPPPPPGAATAPIPPTPPAPPLPPKQKGEN